MAYGNAKGEINFREIARKQFVKHFAHHSKAVHALKFIPNSTQLAAGADDFNLSVCDFVSGRVVQIYKKLHSDFVRAVEPFHENSNVVISGSYDKTVRIYDIREPQAGHKHLMEHGAEVEAMQIFNTDLSLATVGGKLVAHVKCRPRSGTCACPTHPSTRSATTSRPSPVSRLLKAKSDC